MKSKHEFSWAPEFFEKPKPSKPSTGPSALWAVICALLLGSLALIALSGCEAENAKQTERASPSPVVSAPTYADVLAYKVEIGSDPDPNKYIVILTWNQGAQPWPWAVRRVDPKSKTNPVIIKVGDRGVYFDTSAEPGKTYKYVLGSMHGEDFLRSADKEVTIPQDLVVRGRVKLDDTQSFGRIFFEENSTLTTNGKPLKLTVTEIVSKWGTIETFPESQKARAGTNGRTPGEIRINAERATGRLRIISRGETGGDGLDGSSGQKGALGFAGTSGSWGMNPELYKVFSRNFIDSFERFMRQYPKPPGDREWNFTLGEMRRFVCASQPTNGGRGGAGSPGGDGCDGGIGGDSSRVYIAVTENGDFQVSVSAEPGKAGLAGRIGKGGEGGAGGPPGPLDQAHLCQPAHEGNRGEPGMDGRQGRIGVAGNKRPFCAKIGDRTLGDCESWTKN